MLKILDEKIRKTPENIEKEYPNCKYIITNFTDIQNMDGYLYCISADNDSFYDICVVQENLEKKGIPSYLLGSYNNGGAFGVQYEVKQ